MLYSNTHTVIPLNYTSFLDILDKEEAMLMLSIMTRKEFRKQTIIFSEAQPAESIFILEKGNVTLTIPGTRSIFVRRGEMFGEIAVINESERLGTAIAKTDTTVLEINANVLYDPKIVPSIIALKITKIIARKHARKRLKRVDFSTRELLEDGESAHIEFKSTLRKNLHTGKNDPKIELAVLKTIGAFLNSNGGTLLIGIADDGTTLGLEADRFANEDKLLLHFSHLIKDKIGKEALPYIHYNITNINNQKILRVDIEKSGTPIFVTFQDNEFFYIRSGPSTINLSLSEFYNYLKQQS